MIEHLPSMCEVLNSDQYCDIIRIKKMAKDMIKQYKTSREFRVRAGR
jgi:hypothetical protein